MTDPVVSICVPTYNRARYLRCMLEHCTKNIGGLAHPYEMLIADNASADDTEAVVAEFKGRLNITYFKREQNYGAYDNQHFLKKHARGVVQLYLADDDTLIFPQLSAVVDTMLADPAIGVVFAPWKLYDRVADKQLGTFYSLEADCAIPQGDYGQLLALILQRHIFPEIYVIRSDLARAAAAFTHPLAYWAFVQAAEYLSFSKIMFRKEPYYTTITNYFPGEGDRGQFGHAEVQDHWDRYRGGLEYILARIPPAQLTNQQKASALMQIQRFIAIRLNVALKLRIQGKRDPIDTYYLACRLKAMGFPELIPAPFGAICGAAIVRYILTGHVSSDRFEKILCVGDIDAGLRKMLSDAGNLPVEDVAGFDPAMHRNALVLVPGSARTGFDHVMLADHQLRVLGLEDLLRKFG